MKYYVVKFTGPFGFIKPWTAVRDASGGETYSQQFLTPSIVEGIRQKLEVKSILRHRLIYAGIDVQQEVVQAKAWSNINGKTNCSTFTKHFVPNLILLTQNKMCILIRWFHLFTSFVYLCISLA